MTPNLQTAMEAAQLAGARLRRKLSRTRQVSYKGLRDIVTDADLEAERTVLALLHERYPAHAVLAEEGQHDLDLAGPRPTWIVDPLDGTTNYSRRLPCFAVAIALAQAGQVLVGVTHDPLRGETFYAERGGGAWRQGPRGKLERLRVSEIAAVDEMLLGVDWARDPEMRERVIGGMVRVAGVCRSVRALGSAALGLAYVGAGWLDGYFHLALAPWDVAAGALIIAEAGGTVTAAGGEPWRLGERAVTASNGRAHEALVRALAFAPSIVKETA